MNADGWYGTWFHGAYYPICDITTGDHIRDAEGVHFEMKATQDPSFPGRLLEHFERDGVPEKIYLDYWGGR